MSLKVSAFVAACLALAAGVAMFAAPAQNRPGEITPPHVWIENREASDAIPVVVQNTGTPVRVLVTGLPGVTIESANTLPIAPRSAVVGLPDDCRAERAGFRESACGAGQRRLGSGGRPPAGAGERDHTAEETSVAGTTTGRNLQGD